jgi:excisionase family DNA binding protein
MTDPDRILDEKEVADHLHISPADVKRAWREGRLRGARFGSKYRFRLCSVETFLQAEEARWQEQNSAALGSTGSPGSSPGTSIGTTQTPDGSGDEALALKIASELKNRSASSSSKERAPKNRPQASLRIVTP